MARLLLVDPDVESLGRFAPPLLGLNHLVFGARDLAEAEQVMGVEVVDVVLLSLRMGTGSGLEALERLKGWDPTVEVVIVTNADGPRVAIRAVRMGAFDILDRAAPDDSMVSMVESALRKRVVNRQVQQLQRRLSELTSAQAPVASEAMRQVQTLTRKAAASDVACLVTGESGAGKELVARDIVGLGGRAEGPLITVDCGALPSSLAESELFGYEKGAFTGANARKLGRIEAADGGTVLLDEIGNLPLKLQPILLRVLELREVQRVGGTRPTRLDVRFIAMTNSDLPSLVRAGSFRADLYHRVNVFPIHVPPLRERTDDILPIAEHFLAEFNQKHRKETGPISEESRVRLMSYAWPGNVRELRNVVERAVILADGPIEPEHLLGMESPTGAPASHGPAISLHEAKEQAGREAALRLIGRVLKQTGGDKKEAARLLGVSLKTLYNHLKTAASDEASGS